MKIRMKKLRVNDDKGGGQAEKARPTIENEKPDLFSLWMFDSDVQHVLMSLISLLGMNIIFFHFKFL